MMRPATLLLAALLCACGPSETSRGVVDALPLGENWMIVNYWAEWCAPCRKEIPELNKLALRNSQIGVYAVNFDGVQGEALLQQAAELDIQFPLLTVDPGEGLGLTRPNVLPTTLIISPQGEEVTRLIGPQTEEGLLKELALARASRQTTPG